MSNQPAILDECVILDTAIQSMTQNSHQARRDLDKQHISQAINSMSEVCQHLRTASLAPDLYYDLYQRTTEILMEFEGYFDDIDAQQRESRDSKTPSLEKLHEVVQYCADIIPRLYLTITVSSALIKTRRVPCRAILFDLTELCRGVQQPIHGLFLRSYLSLMMKDKLPDVGTVYHDPNFHGEVTDAIDFVLENFSQMNRLWVRMQHQGTGKDRSKRESQRRTLQQLVGANLYRLSDLQGLTYHLYKTHVLPRLLDEVINCKDVMAQEFLMDCIIQAFSDEFQIGTLELYLNALTQLNERVSLQKLLTALLQRLSRFGQSLLEGTISLRDLTDQECGLQRLQSLFPLISSTIQDIIVSKNLTLQNSIVFYSTLLSYISIIHTDRLDYIDTVLKNAIDILRSRRDEYQEQHKVLNGALLALISAPIQFLKLRFFELQHVAPLFTLLSNTTKRTLGFTTCQALLASQHVTKKDKDEEGAEKAPVPVATTVSIAEVGVADAVFSLLLPLIRNDGDEEGNDNVNSDGTKDPIQYNDDGTPKKDTGNLENYQLEQNFTLVSRVLHLINDTNIEIYFKMLITARKYLGQGIPSSLSLTLPTLLALSYKLAQRIYAIEQAAIQLGADEATTKAAMPPIRTKRILHFIHETLQQFSTYDPQQALRLYIQASLVADQLFMEPISYEFVAQAFLTYEERISDSRQRLQALSYIMANIPNLRNWTRENYDNISQACFRHANAYMIKTDQARCLANCTHLHWVVSDDEVKNTPEDEQIRTKEDGSDEVLPQRHADKVAAYLRRALAIARDQHGHQTILFMEILNKFIFFYQKRCPTTQTEHIVGLTDLIVPSIQTAIDQGLGKPIRNGDFANTPASGHAGTQSAITPQQQTRQTVLYFKNTIQYMITLKLLNKDHPAVLLAAQIQRD
jgi:vacuolar protein sorting-associated protein 35